MEQIDFLDTQEDLPLKERIEEAAKQIVEDLHQEHGIPSPAYLKLLRDIAGRRQSQNQEQSRGHSRGF